MFLKSWKLQFLFISIACLGASAWAQQPQPRPGQQPPQARPAQQQPQQQQQDQLPTAADIAKRLRDAADNAFAKTSDLIKDKIIALNWRDDKPLVCHRLGMARILILGVADHFEVIIIGRVLAKGDSRTTAETATKLRNALAEITAFPATARPFLDRLASFCGVPVADLGNRIREAEVLLGKEDDAKTEATNLNTRIARLITAIKTAVEGI